MRAYLLFNSVAPDEVLQAASDALIGIRGIHKVTIAPRNKEYVGFGMVFVTLSDVVHSKPLPGSDDVTNGALRDVWQVLRDSGLSLKFIQVRDDTDHTNGRLVRSVSGHEANEFAKHLGHKAA